VCKKSSRYIRIYRVLSTRTYVNVPELEHAVSPVFSTLCEVSYKVCYPLQWNIHPSKNCKTSHPQMSTEQTHTKNLLHRRCRLLTFVLYIWGVHGGTAGW